MLGEHPGGRLLDIPAGGEPMRAAAEHLGYSVVALDLFPSPGFRGVRADACAPLPLRSASFDAVLSMEGIEHFEDQAGFLRECARVLRPGGRLVLVDFVWRDAQPEAIASADPRRLVRDTWRFEEFEPLERYRKSARELGLVERACHDWTGPVIDRFQRIAATISRLGTLAPSRALLCAVRPGLARIQPDEWRFLVELMRAHDAVRRRSRYVALVFEKPRA
jgi:SAM-dependent methyltransferase